MRAAGTFLSLITLITLSGDITAQPKDKGSAYAQAGRASAAGRQVYGTANVSGAVLDASGVPACFAWDVLLTFSAKGGEAVCVFAMDAAVTLGGVNTAAAFTITDANGADGPGAGFLVPNGGSRDKVPGYLEAYRSPGARSGVCTGAVQGPGRHVVYPPCRVDGDCTTAGSPGTCDTATAVATRLAKLARLGCTFAVCQVDTDGTILTWEEDK
jgi:hypothetical protein